MSVPCIATKLTLRPLVLFPFWASEQKKWLDANILLSLGQEERDTSLILSQYFFRAVGLSRPQLIPGPRYWFQTAGSLRTRPCGASGFWRGNFSKKSLSTDNRLGCGAGLPSHHDLRPASTDLRPFHHLSKELQPLPAQWIAAMHFTATHW